MAESSQVTNDVSIDRSLDSAGSDASTANDQHFENVTPHQSLLNFHKQVFPFLSEVGAEMSANEIENFHQQLAVQALKNGDFKAVAQISAWMARNSSKLSKQHQLLSSEKEISALKEEQTSDKNDERKLLISESFVPEKTIQKEIEQRFNHSEANSIIDSRAHRVNSSRDSEQFFSNERPEKKPLQKNSTLTTEDPPPTSDFDRSPSISIRDPLPRSTSLVLGSHREILEQAGGCEFIQDADDADPARDISRGSADSIRFRNGIRSQPEIFHRGEMQGELGSEDEEPGWGMRDVELAAEPPAGSRHAEGGMTDKCAAAGRGKEPHRTRSPQPRSGIRSPRPRRVSIGSGLRAVAPARMESARAHLPLPPPRGGRGSSTGETPITTVLQCGAGALSRRGIGSKPSFRSDHFSRSSSSSLLAAPPAFVISPGLGVVAQGQQVEHPLTEPEADGLTLMARPAPSGVGGSPDHDALETQLAGASASSAAKRFMDNDDMFVERHGELDVLAADDDAAATDPAAATAADRIPPDPPSGASKGAACGGLTFTSLLVGTMEAGAAGHREECELNPLGRGRDALDRAAAAKRRRDYYAPHALLCLPLDCALRRACCALTEWRWFDRLVLATIAANCAFMAMEDPTSRDGGGDYGRMLYDAGVLFQALFTAEAAAKVLARGFLFGRNAYMRDWWNVLDFTTVLLGLAEYVVVTMGASTSVLRSFRLVRPLRALRAVGRFKDLRMIVNLIISCLPLLADVFALISFIFVVFGIVGVQLWGGYLRGRCYDEDNGGINAGAVDRVCSMAGDVGMSRCGPGESCLRIYMNPQYDALSFDSIGPVLVIIFQVMVQQKWNAIMYLVWDAYSFWSWPYFVLLNLVGPMFAVQLFLVVVANQYSAAKARQREAEKAAVELFEVKVGVVAANIPRAVSAPGNQSSFDPYVLVSVDERSKRTRVIKGGAVPEWNEYFVFPVSSAASRAAIDVRSWRRRGEHETVGRLSIPVGTLDQRDEGTDRWYEVCGPDGAAMEGSLRIRTQWRGSPGEEWSPLPEVDDEDMPEEEDAEDDDPSRAQRLQAALRALAESRELTVLSVLVICANMLAMAADHDCDLLEDDYCRRFKAQLEQANLAFTTFFALEMVVKAWGLGPLAYFKDASNAFDFLVLVMSLAELPASAAQVRCYLDSSQEDILRCEDDTGGFMSILRSFRMVRILRLGKLVELFPQIRRQLKVITRTLGAVSSLVLLILMYLVIFAILGMSLLGGGAVESLRSADPDSVPSLRPGSSVRVLVPSDPFTLETARVITFDPSRRSHGYLVARGGGGGPSWPAGNVSSAGGVWEGSGRTWLDARELEPFQYGEFASSSREATIVGLVPRGNFDSFATAAVTVFQVFTTSDLGDVMYPAIRGAGMFASLFFAAQILLGNLLLFNLFTGIIITGFSETKEELQREDLENQRMVEQDRLRRAQSLARGPSLGGKGPGTSGGGGFSLSRGLSVASSMGGNERCSALEGLVARVKGLVLRSNRVTADDLRKSAAAALAGTAAAEPEKEPTGSRSYRVVSSRYFEWVIMLSIFLSSTALAIQRPQMSPLEENVISVVDVFVGVVFLVECLLKISACGFYRYIGSRWNQLDLFLVLTTCIDLIVTWAASGAHVEFLSTFRIIRSLRPLRVISRMKKLRDTFTTITRAFVPVLNTIVIALCVFFIFGIMAVQLLGGR